MPRKNLKRLWRLIAGAGGPILSQREIGRIWDREEVRTWANEDTFAFLRAVHDSMGSSHDESSFVDHFNTSLFTRGSPYDIWRRQRSRGKREWTLDRITGVTLARNFFVTSFNGSDQFDMQTPWGFVTTRLGNTVVSGFLVAKCQQQTRHVHAVFSFACPVPLQLLQALNMDKHVEPLASRFCARRYILSQATHKVEEGSIKKEGEWEDRLFSAVPVFWLRRDPINDFPSEYMEDITIKPDATVDQVQALQKKLHETDKLCVRAQCWLVAHRQLIMRELTLNRRVWYAYFV